MRDPHDNLWWPCRDWDQMVSIIRDAICEAGLDVRQAAENRVIVRAAGQWIELRRTRASFIEVCKLVMEAEPALSMQRTEP